MGKSWVEEQLEETANELRKLKQKENELGSHPSRVRKIEELSNKVENWGKILKNQEGWSKEKVRRKIKKLTT